MKNTKKRKNRILLALMAMTLFGFLAGTTCWFLYTKDARGIHSIVYEDFSHDASSQEKIIVSHELLRDMSVIPKSISLPYSYRELVEQQVTGNDANISQILNSANPNWTALSWYAAMEGCDYLAYPRGTYSQEITAAGYSEIGVTDNYSVYRHNGKKYENAWLITQHGNADGDQQMFYTLQNRNGNLIVIDGGYESNAETVRRLISHAGNHVDAWIVTHPHPDHAGAFCEIYSNSEDITIDRVYAVDMASPKLCQENATWDDMTCYLKWLSLDIPQLSYVYTDDRFEVAGLDFHILSAYGDYVDEISDDLLNDGSMLFKITAEKESMLFCSDVGISMSDYILNDAKDALKADIIQMGHHGNGGLAHYFYRYVAPKAAFFDAPNWLMEDANNQYTTPENKELMQEIGAEVYSFSTAPNCIILE